MSEVSPRRTAAEPGASKPAVLLVDDRPENLLALEAVLADDRIRLVRATSGDEALQRMLREEFALVLMDVQMPGLDGFETVALIKQRARSQHVPIIFVTGIYLDDVHLRQGYEVGAVDYILKPFEPDVLRTKVSVFVDLYMQQARLARRARELEARAGHVEVLQKLRELERLKDDFLSATSHELRTPLTSIIGFAELLADEVGGALSPEQLAFVRSIQVGGARLKALIDDLLDFARLDAGVLELACEDLDAGPVVAEAVEALRPLAEASGVALAVDRPAAPVVVAMDRRRVAHVLGHLVGNALKFTPAGGRVDVRARAADDALVVEVHDTGIGIAQEHLPHLFERFFQVDPGITRAQGGTGLGLSIAKAFIEAQGGRIGALSELGCGSTFWFTLPRAREA